MTRGYCTDPSFMIIDRYEEERWNEIMAEFFKPEDVKAGQDAIAAWCEKFPEASNELKKLWTDNFLKCGHKVLARMLTKKSDAGQ